MGKLGSKWADKLSKLANDGNEDAQALLQKPGNISEYLALKILAAAGDEGAADLVARKEESNKRSQEKLKKLIASGDPGAIARYDRRKAQQKRRWGEKIQLMADAGDAGAIAKLEKRKAQEERKIAKSKSAVRGETSLASGTGSVEPTLDFHSGDSASHDTRMPTQTYSWEQIAAGSSKRSIEKALPSPPQSSPPTTGSGRIYDEAYIEQLKIDFEAEVAEVREEVQAELSTLQYQNEKLSKQLEDCEAKTKAAKEEAAAECSRAMDLERKNAHLELELMRARQRVG